MIPVTRTTDAVLHLALRTLSYLVAALPLRMALALGRLAGWITGNLVRFRRREVFEAIRRSFTAEEKTDAECWRIVDRMWLNLGMNMAETLRMCGGREKELFERITVVGEHHIHDAAARGHGVLVLTAHSGNFELLGTWTTSTTLPPLTILVKEIRNRAINDMVMQMRGRLVHETSVVRNSTRALREALRALSRNEMVSFLLDQNTTYNEGVFVTFFDRLCCTSHGLAKMAARNQTPVVPVFIRRTADNRHEINFSAPIDPPALRDRHAIQEATQEYTRRIEDEVRRHPEQWIWIHRRWRTQISDIPPELRDSYILPADALAAAE